jgi:hypothetical protein
MPNFMQTVVNPVPANARLFQVLRLTFNYYSDSNSSLPAFFWAGCIKHKTYFLPPIAELSEAVGLPAPMFFMGNDWLYKII